MASALTQLMIEASLPRDMSFPQPLRAVVTGAGGGLGRALSLELAGRGASLVVSDVDQQALEETARLTRKEGAQTEIIPCDVTDRNAVFDLVEETEKRLGGIDFIANNAGVSVGGLFDEISIEDWRWIVDINLWGVIYGCQAAVPKMKAQGRGYILNVASAAGLLTPPTMSPYNVTKAGVVALSETLCAEYKSAGIHVAVLCPTFFKTDIIKTSRGTSTPKEKAQVMKWMERSKVQAPEVAKAAIDSVRDGRLYVQPMPQGRKAWRIKRLAPERYYDSLSKTHQRFVERRHKA